MGNTVWYCPICRGPSLLGISGQLDAGKDWSVHVDESHLGDLLVHLELVLVDELEGSLVVPVLDGVRSLRDGGSPIVPDVLDAGAVGHVHDVTPGSVGSLSLYNMQFLRIKKREGIYLVVLSLL